jgi:hypothetical protein
MKKIHQKILNDKDFIKFVYAYNKVKTNNNPDNLIKQLYDDVLLPSTIFVSELGCLEAVVKYLKENLEISFKNIAVKLEKSEANIRISYSNSKKKYAFAFDTITYLTKDNHSGNVKLIPLRSFLNNLSMLESLVCFLKDEQNMRFSEIAKILSRDQRTIWTVYNRALKKRIKNK